MRNAFECTKLRLIKGKYEYGTQEKCLKLIRDNLSDKTIICAENHANETLYDKVIALKINPLVNLKKKNKKRKKDE